MGRTKHGQSWINRHLSDPFVRKAQQEGYRSRASFKILELQTKDKLFHHGQTIVDLGAAPGGWSQVLAKIVGNRGKVVALDILEMGSIPGVTFIQGDFTQESTLKLLQESITGKIDWVISDMSPNLSGIKSVDQPGIMHLAELALDFAQDHLKENGGFIVKIFQGEGFEQYHKALKKAFAKVVIRKPTASRSASRELYVLAQGYYNI